MKTITGNTYPVKERLKSLGARWNRDAQGWDVADEVAEEAQSIVDGAGPVQAREYRRGSRYGSSYARFAGGAEWYQNKKGRCEDAPCCGCCS